MEIRPSGDQQLLAQTSAKLIESEYPMARVRDALGSAGDGGARYRERSAELGWYSLFAPEEAGGGSVSGNAAVDAALIAYERGQVLQPGPFVATNVVALAVAATAGPERVASTLAPLMSGEQAATWAVTGSAGAGPAAGAGAAAGPGATAGVTAVAEGGQWVLDGTKVMVQDADWCALMLVTAAGPEGPVQFLLPTTTSGITVARQESLDLTRSWCRVDFERVAIPESYRLAGDDPRGLIDRQLDLACVLTVAESVGAMDQDFAMALEYAKDRTAFGRPIGSFQAVKHLLADTSLMLETSKALALDAARAVGAGDTDASSLASAAKAYIGDCGIDVAQNCFQVFGGIGYTWEHDQHLYLRRLTADAALYGDPSWHRERLCRLGGL